MAFSPISHREWRLISRRIAEVMKNGWRSLLAIGLLAVALSALTACMPSLDAEQGRLCRMLLPALYAEDEGISIISSDAGTGNSVHLSFRLGSEASTKTHLLTCRFGGTGFSAAKRDLVAVLVDGVGIGESAFHILRDQWLESPHAVRADPGPPKREGGWQMSRTGALVLQHAVSGLPRLGILALLALATALIYGLIGRINIAFGEVAAFGGIATTLSVLVLGLNDALPLPLVAALAILNMLTITALAGQIIGRLVLWPLSQGRGQPLLVAGVGMLIALQEGLRLLQGAGTIWLPPVGGDAVILAQATGFAVTLTPRLIAMVGVDALAVIGTLLLMYRTRFGRAWRAMADDPLAASLMGIDPKTLLILVSALASMLAALAGATITLNYGGMHFSGGTMIGLTALMAAILGGIGSLGGAVFGALVIGAFQVTWFATQPIAHWELATFTLLTLALILKPDGFFGQAGVNDKHLR